MGQTAITHTHILDGQQAYPSSTLTGWGGGALGLLEVSPASGEEPGCPGLLAPRSCFSLGDPGPTADMLQ